MKRYICCVLAVLLLATGCSIFVKPPEKTATGDRVVCILFKDGKEFKRDVVKYVSENLAGKGYTVVTGDVKRAKHYSSHDYAAVVYMSEYWMRHTPWHAKRYFERNKEARNTLFVITSGDPDIEIHRPFDAVTSTSARDRATQVSQEIIGKLDRILK